MCNANEVLFKVSPLPSLHHPNIVLHSVLCTFVHKRLVISRLTGAGQVPATFRRWTVPHGRTIFGRFLGDFVDLAILLDNHNHRSMTAGGECWSCGREKAIPVDSGISFPSQRRFARKKSLRKAPDWQSIVVHRDSHFRSLARSPISRFTAPPGAVLHFHPFATFCYTLSTTASCVRCNNSRH